MFALASFQCDATTVIAPRFEKLVDRADLIFTGHVISQQSRWQESNGQRVIMTFVSFAVQQVHKGRANSSVTLQFLGGTVGNVTLDVTETPKFKQGERVVLFVEGNGVNVSPVVGFYHGKFVLQRDSSGRDNVLQHNGEPLVSVTQLGRAKSAAIAARREQGISHEEFLSQIQRRLSASKQ